MSIDINLIPPEELGKGSNIKLNVCEHTHDIYVDIEPKHNLAVESIVIKGE